jgi:hypothetical protein
LCGTLLLEIRVDEAVFKVFYMSMVKLAGRIARKMAVFERDNITAEESWR